MSEPRAGSAFDLTPADLAHLDALGIEPSEAERQLRLLRDPPTALRLDRACVLGDGIRRLTADELTAAERRAGAAIDAGRLTRFVPASGAASRMFQALRAEPEARGRLVEALDRFPFLESLDRSFAGTGSSLAEARDRGLHEEIVERLLGEPGLDLARSPKGLLEFHRYPDGPRTAFEEHLAEAAELASSPDGVCKLHFTVSEEHREPFEERLSTFAAAYPKRFEVSFSAQSPATDTLATELDGRPFRRDDGTLLLRPGGHGALIRNLADLGGDLVLIKNIDNILPAERRELVVLWHRRLIGWLVVLQERAFELSTALEAGDAAAVEEAARFSAAEFGATWDGSAGDREAVMSALDRPIRVCAVVRNESEPGGGPFWAAAEGERPTRQVVEGAQVADDPEQQEVFRSGTHFNPVHLVCGLRDHRGRSHALERFVDPRAVFIARKSQGDRELLALERPGLWNGAMAHWNTVFVEVPVETFGPVKTIFDLLRPAHQPATGA